MFNAVSAFPSMADAAAQLPVSQPSVYYQPAPPPPPPPVAHMQLPPTIPGQSVPSYFQPPPPVYSTAYPPQPQPPAWTPPLNQAPTVLSGPPRSATDPRMKDAIEFAEFAVAAMKVKKALFLLFQVIKCF